MDRLFDKRYKSVQTSCFLSEKRGEKGKRNVLEKKILPNAARLGAAEARFKQQKNPCRSAPCAFLRGLFFQNKKRGNNQKTEHVFATFLVKMTINLRGRYIYKKKAFFFKKISKSY